MDGVSVPIDAGAALAKLTPRQRPVLDATSERRGPLIQSDHGSAFAACELASTLAESRIGHALIRPHTPTENAFVERHHRTIGAQLDEQEPVDEVRARAVIGTIINHYNHHRLHSSLNFLRPVDYYAGDPAVLLAKRRRKLQTARALRKQENVRLRQRRPPRAEEKPSLIRRGQLSQLRLPDGKKVRLSPARHNRLHVAFITEFGAPITEHDKLRDIVLYCSARTWLFLIEAVTSHGPVSPKRRQEIEALLADCPAERVYVTAFPDVGTFRKYAADIVWETEVWIADNPDHMIHFNGPKFLGPQATTTEP
jgi:hypothetical protein